MTLMKMRSFCDRLGQEKYGYVVGQNLDLVFFHHFSRQRALKVIHSLFPLKKPTMYCFQLAILIYYEKRNPRANVGRWQHERFTT